VFLALMTSDLSGRPLSAPQAASFISAQQRGEVKGEALLEALALLSPGVNSYLGVLHRNDYSLMVMSARLPLAVSADNNADQPLNPQNPAPAVMVSSLSLVKGVPILIGLSSNSEQAADIPLLWSLCQSLTLYLQISNQMPEEGFFNPQMDNLVIAGRKLSFRLPAGQCLLTAGHPRSLAILLQLEAMSRGILIPLLAYAPCQNMSAWLAGESGVILDSYGTLAVNLEDGQLKVRDGISSRQFLESLAQDQTESRTLEPLALDQSFWDDTLKGMTDGSWEELGHFGVDERAGYWAILVKGHRGEESFPATSSQAGIMAVGMVNNLVITSVLYMPLSANNPYTTLLAIQRQLFKELN
jgi:hypothetical protein